jgi:hypothetical protein
LLLGASSSSSELARSFVGMELIGLCKNECYLFILRLDSVEEDIVVLESIACELQWRLPRLY